MVASCLADVLYQDAPTVPEPVPTQIRSGVGLINPTSTASSSTTPLHQPAMGPPPPRAASRRPVLRGRGKGRSYLLQPAGRGVSHEQHERLRDPALQAQQHLERPEHEHQQPVSGRAPQGIEPLGRSKSATLPAPTLHVQGSDPPHSHQPASSSTQPLTQSQESSTSLPPAAPQAPATRGRIRRTARDLHSLFLRFCVKGDGFCQDYSLLSALRVLDHERSSPLTAQKASGAPTQRDRSLVRLLRDEEVEWMQRQGLTFRRRGLSGETEDVDPIAYLPSEAYLNGTFTGVNRTAYGDFNTLAAASAVLEIDIICLTETTLRDVHIPFFTEGKQRSLPAAALYDRVQQHTSPLITIFWNGRTDAGGHYAAGVHQDHSGSPIPPPSGSLPRWLSTAFHDDGAPPSPGRRAGASSSQDGEANESDTSGFRFDEDDGDAFDIGGDAAASSHAGVEEADPPAEVAAGGADHLGGDGTGGDERDDAGDDAGDGRDDVEPAPDPAAADPAEVEHHDGGDDAVPPGANPQERTDAAETMASLAGTFIAAATSDQPGVASSSSANPSSAATAILDHWECLKAFHLDGDLRLHGLQSSVSSSLLDEIAYYSQYLEIEENVVESGVSLGRGLRSRIDIPPGKTFAIQGGHLIRDTKDVEATHRGYIQRISESAVYVDAHSVDVASLPPAAWGQLINSSQGLHPRPTANAQIHAILPRVWGDRTPPGFMGVWARGNGIPAGSRIYLNYRVQTDPRFDPAPTADSTPSMEPSSRAAHTPDTHELRAARQSYWLDVVDSDVSVSDITDLWQQPAEHGFSLHTVAFPTVIDSDSGEDHPYSELSPSAATTPFTFTVPPEFHCDGLAAHQRPEEVTIHTVIQAVALCKACFFGTPHAYHTLTRDNLTVAAAQAFALEVLGSDDGNADAIPLWNAILSRAIREGYRRRAEACALLRTSLVDTGHSTLVGIATSSPVLAAWHSGADDGDAVDVSRSGQWSGANIAGWALMVVREHIAHASALLNVRNLASTSQPLPPPTSTAPVVPPRRGSRNRTTVVTEPAPEVITLSVALVQLENDVPWTAVGGMSGPWERRQRTWLSEARSVRNLEPSAALARGSALISELLAIVSANATPHDEGGDATTRAFAERVAAIVDADSEPAKRRLTDLSQLAGDISAHLLAANQSTSSASDEPPPGHQPERVLGVDGQPLPFFVAASTVGPRSTDNRGLFVAPGCTIKAGYLCPIHIDHFIIGRDQPAADEVDALAAWWRDLEDQERRAERAGFYVIDLNLRYHRHSSPVVYRAEGSPPCIIAKGDAPVTASSLAPVSLGVCHPDNSPMHLLNDAAWRPDITAAQYSAFAARRNHAEFTVGLDASGIATEAYMHFRRGANAGEEVFASYGYAFWQDQAEGTSSSSSPTRALAACDRTDTAGAPWGEAIAETLVWSEAAGPVPHTLLPPPSVSRRTRSDTAGVPLAPSISNEDVPGLAARLQPQIQSLATLLQQRSEGYSQEADRRIATAVSLLTESTLNRATRGVGDDAGHDAAFRPHSCEILARNLFNLRARHIVVIGCGTGLEWAVLTAIAQNWGRPLKLELVDNIADHVLATRLLFYRVAAAVADDLSIAQPAQLDSSQPIQIGDITIRVLHADGFRVTRTPADIVYSAASTACHSKQAKSISSHLHAIAGGYATLIMHSVMWESGRGGAHIAPDVPLDSANQLSADNFTRALKAKDLRAYPRFYQKRPPSALVNAPANQTDFGPTAIAWPPPNWPLRSSEDLSALQDDRPFARVHLRPGGWAPLNFSQGLASAGLNLRRRVAVFWRFDHWWYFGNVIALDPENDVCRVQYDDSTVGEIHVDDHVLALPSIAGDAAGPSRLQASDANAGEKRGGGHHDADQPSSTSRSTRSSGKQPQPSQQQQDQQTKKPRQQATAPPHLLPPYGGWDCATCGSSRYQCVCGAIIFTCGCEPNYDCTCDDGPRPAPPPPAAASPDGRAPQLLDRLLPDTSTWGFNPPKQSDDSDRARCSTCGVSVPACLVQCSETRLWFCNTVYSHKNRSCIIRHLGENGMCGVRLHTASPLSRLRLSCESTGVDDIFQLGVSISDHVVHVTMAAETPSANGIRLTWLPMVSSGALSSWLVRPAQIGELPADIDTIHSEITCALSAGDAAVTKFEDIRHYHRHFSDVLRQHAEDEERSPGNLNLRNASVLWDVELNNRPIATFSNRLFSLRVKVGELVTLSRMMDDGSTWTSNGAIRSVSDSSVSIVLERGLQGHTSKFTVRSSLATVNVDRMQSQLKAFAIDEFACSRAIFNTILGLHYSNGPSFILDVTDANSDGDEASLNEEQRLALTRARNALSLIQGPPGTGKTRTAVSIIKWMCRQGLGPPLVTAPSNTAADHLAIKVSESAPQLKVIRLYKRSHAGDHSVPEQLTLQFHVQRVVDGHEAELIRLQDKLLKARRQRGKDVKFRQGASRDLEKQITDVKQVVERNAKFVKLKGVQARNGALIDEHEDELRSLTKKVENEALDSADVIVITNSVAADRRITSRAPFAQVLQDEATQAIEPESLMALTLGCRRVVLIGDQCQLGPVVKSPGLQARGLHISLFERLLAYGDIPVTFLKVQHRMHPAIAAFPSTQFYDGRLVSAPGLANLRRLGSHSTLAWASRDAPIIVLNVNGTESTGAQGSYHNDTEARAVLEALHHLQRDGVLPEDVVVITPYRGQCAHIRSLTTTSFPNVRVSSVDSMQGQESDFIILSTVRSNDRRLAGFVPNPRRLNVALTRARRGLIVICNVATLSLHGDFVEYFKHVRSIGAVRTSLVGMPDHASEAAAAALMEPPSGSFTSNCANLDLAALAWQPELGLAQLLALFIADAQHAHQARLALKRLSFDDILQALDEEGKFETILRSLNPVFNVADITNRFGTRPYLPGARRYAVQLRPPAFSSHSGRLGARATACLAASGLQDIDSTVGPDEWPDEDTDLTVKSGVDRSLDLHAEFLLAADIDDSPDASRTASSLAVAYSDTVQGFSMAARAILGNLSHIRNQLSALASRECPRFSRTDRAGRVVILQRTLAWFRRCAWLLRGRLFGWMDAANTSLYWRYANRTDPAAAEALADLVRRCRYDSGASTPWGRDHSQPVRFGAGGPLALRCRWPSPTVGIRWTLVESPPSDAVLLNCPALSLAVAAAYLESPDKFRGDWSRQGCLFSKAILAKFLAASPPSPIQPNSCIITDQGTFVTTPNPTLPHAHTLRRGVGAPYFAVRPMRCKFGALAALGLQATSIDYQLQCAVGDEHISYYAENITTLLALEPRAVILYGGGLPGLPAAGAAKLGMPGVIVDASSSSVTALRAWFQRNHDAGQAKVTIFAGTGCNALVNTVCDKAARLHDDDGGAVVVGRLDTMNCQPLSTISNISGGSRVGTPEESGLAHSTANGIRERDQFNRPFMSENVRGSAKFNSRHGADCTRFTFTSLGGRTNDEHTITHHPYSPLIIDSPLRQGERDLFRRSCCGRSRPMQPLGPDSMPPSCACCEGECTSLVGSGRGLRHHEVCRLLGVTPGCPATNRQLVSALPLPQGALVVAQLAMHRLHLQWGIPVISKDAARTDPKLEAWRSAIHADIRESNRAVLDIFPVSTITILVTPTVTDGFTCVDSSGMPTTVHIDPRAGHSIELLAARALQAQFPELRVISNDGLHTLRFEADLRSLDSEQSSIFGSLLFSAAFVGDDVGSLPLFDPTSTSSSSTFLRPIAELCASSSSAACLFNMKADVVQSAPALAVSPLPLHVPWACDYGSDRRIRRPVTRVHNALLTFDTAVLGSLLACRTQAPPMTRAAAVHTVRPPDLDARLKAYAVDYANTFNADLDIRKINKKAVDSNIPDSSANPVNLRAAALAVSVDGRVLGGSRGCNHFRLFGGYYHARASSKSHNLMTPQRALTEDVLQLLGHLSFGSRILEQLHSAIGATHFSSCRTIASSDASGTGRSWAVPMRQITVQIYCLCLDTSSEPPHSTPADVGEEHFRRHLLHSVLGVRPPPPGAPRPRLHIPAILHGAVQLIPVFTAADIPTTHPAHLYLSPPPSPLPPPPFSPFSSFLATAAQVTSSYCAHNESFLLGLGSALGHLLPDSVRDAAADVIVPDVGNTTDTRIAAIAAATRGQSIASILQSISNATLLSLSDGAPFRDTLIFTAADAADALDPLLALEPPPPSAVDLSNRPWIYLPFHCVQFRQVARGSKTVDSRLLIGENASIYFRVAPGWLLYCTQPGSPDGIWMEVQSRHLFPSHTVAVEAYGDALLPGSQLLTADEISDVFRVIHRQDNSTWRHRFRDPTAAAVVCWELKPTHPSARLPGAQQLLTPHRIQAFKALQPFTSLFRGLSPIVPYPSVGLTTPTNSAPPLPFIAPPHPNPNVGLTTPTNSPFLPPAEGTILSERLPAISATELSPYITDAYERPRPASTEVHLVHDSFAPLDVDQPPAAASSSTLAAAAAIGAENRGGTATTPTPTAPIPEAEADNKPSHTDADSSGAAAVLLQQDDNDPESQHSSCSRQAHSDESLSAPLLRVPRDNPRVKIELSVTLGRVSLLATVEQHLLVAHDDGFASDSSEYGDKSPPLVSERSAIAHTVLPSGVLDKGLRTSEHVICNFVGSNKNHVRQPEATAKLNAKYPHGHFKLRSSDVTAIQIANGDRADLPSVAHLRIGRLQGPGASAGRYVLNATMVEESLGKLSAALQPDGTLRHVTNVIFPSLRHCLSDDDWSYLKGQLSEFSCRVNPKSATIVEETGHFRQRLTRQAAQGLDDLATARREAHAYIDAEVTDDDELRDEYRRLADALHDTIVEGADSAVQRS